MAKAVRRQHLNLRKGHRARNWRKEMAARAVSKTDRPVRTVIFPADVEVGDDIWQEAMKSFDLTNGIQRGGVIYFLLRLHLLGFRLFDSAKKRLVWQCASLMGDGKFSQAWEEQCAAKGIKAKNLLPSALYIDVTNRPRTTAKKTVTDETDPEILAERFVRHVGNDPEMENLAKAMAEKIAAACPTWAEMLASPRVCGECMDQALKEAGFNLPSLAEGFAAAGKHAESTSGEYEKVPVAWEPEAAKWSKVNVPPERMPYIVFARYAEDARRQGKTKANEIIKHVQDHVITANACALSSILNPKTGLGYLRKTPAEVIASDMGATSPEGLAAVRALQEEASVLGEDHLFDIPLAKNGRTELGGRINSWIANYGKRLFALIEGLSEAEPPKLPDLNAMPYSEVLKKGLTASDIERTRIELLDTMKRTGESLARLGGETETGTPGEVDISAVDRLIEVARDFTGQINQVNNLLTQKDMTDAIIRLPAWMGRIERIPRFSGGFRNPKEEQPHHAKELELLLRLRAQHFERIVSRFGKDRLERDVYRHLEAKEQKSPQLNARRNILHRFCKAARDCSPAVRAAVKQWLVSLGHYRKSHVNKFFDNRQGMIYKSPYNKKRHLPYKVLDVSKFIQTDFVSEIGNLLSRLHQEMPHEMDLYRLDGSYMTLLLVGLPDSIDRELVTLDADAASRITLHPSLALRLAEDQVKREDVINLFSTGYGSAIHGVMARLKAKGFVIGGDLSPYEKSPVIYVPKLVSWRMPEHDKRSSVYGPVLASDLCEFNDDGSIDAAQTASNIAKALARGKLPDGVDAKQALALLRQLPHEWHAVAAIKNLGTSRFGFHVSEGKVDTPRLHKGCLRLIGPSRLKKALDETLTHGSKLGTPKVYFRKRMKQHWDGKKVEIADDSIRIEFHIPVTEKLPEIETKEAPVLEDRTAVLGVDLNKRDIGFAVVDIETGEVRTTLKVKTRRVRLLEDRLENYRNRTQPNQRYGVLFNTSLANAKEAAVAEIVSIIDGVAERFKAIPVLENIGKSPSRGGAHIAAVFEDVVRHYTFSTVDAHKQLRVQHWVGGDRWQVSSFVQPKKSGRKKALRPELSASDLELVPVSIFPGTAVSAFRTSTTCSKCGRDAMAQAYEVRNSGIEFTTDQDGCIDLGDGRIQIEAPARVTKEERKRLNKRRLRAPYVPLEPNMTIEARDLVDRLRICVRRPDRNMNSKAGNGAWFHCPYIDCKHVMDSSLNAAVNIARRWIQNQKERTEAFQQWDQLPIEDRREVLQRIGIEA